MRSSDFGTLHDGRAIQAWRLDNSSGLSVTVLTYGARIAKLDVPVGAVRRNVVLGFATLDEYLQDGAHQGAVVGRYANRIAGGRFSLDGREYALSVNNGPNTLHGGAVGFDRLVWDAAPDGDALVLTHVSRDGDQGFPGRLEARVRYRLTTDALEISYEARTDAPTVVNLSNHAYFNLSGEADVLGHTLTISADAFTPVDVALIPTGELRPVADTPFDFRTPATVGARIGTPDEQLLRGAGYDHNFVLRDAPAPAPVPAARLEAAGLVMEVLTTEPGVQFYSGNFLNGRPFPRRSALCLETQHFPDSPNKPAFPSTVLRPGEVFRSVTLFRFASA
jgi:aldose 1-epimerase